jgi:Protein of unknown function (DUF2612)
MSGYAGGGYGVGGYGGAGGPIFSLPTSYYLNLLTSEYRLAPNLNAWLAAALGPLNDLTSCLATYTVNFDLDYAEGTQLDALGEIVGVGRVLPFQPSGSVSPTLDDNTYRLLLRATIARNEWDGTIDGLQSFWQAAFPGGSIVIEDNQNMTANIILTGSFSSIVQDLITHGMIVPRPEGVQYSYNLSTLPLFGFDESNSYIAGFDAGHMA